MKETVLVCDLCGVRGSTPGVDVRTHTLTLDGQVVEREACDPCWGGVLSAVEPFTAAGRRVRTR